MKKMPLSISVFCAVAVVLASAARAPAGSLGDNSASLSGVLVSAEAPAATTTQEETGGPPAPTISDKMAGPAKPQGPTVSAAPPATTPAVDPAIVGQWSLVLPTQAGPVHLSLIIRPDGTYSFSGDNPAIMSHAGRFSTDDHRYWSMLSPAWQDAGTYRLIGPNRMLLVGKLGPGIWTRASAPAQTPRPTVSDARWHAHTLHLKGTEPLCLMSTTLQDHLGLNISFDKTGRQILVILPKKGVPQLDQFPKFVFVFDDYTHEYAIGKSDIASGLIEIDIADNSQFLNKFLAAHRATLFAGNDKLQIPLLDRKRSYEKALHCLSSLTK